MNKRGQQGQSYTRSTPQFSERVSNPRTTKAKILPKLANRRKVPCIFNEKEFNEFHELDQAKQAHPQELVYRVEDATVLRDSIKSSYNTRSTTTIPTISAQSSSSELPKVLQPTTPNKIPRKTFVASTPLPSADVASTDVTTAQNTTITNTGLPLRLENALKIFCQHHQIPWETIVCPCLEWSECRNMLQNGLYYEYWTIISRFLERRRITEKMRLDPANFPIVYRTYLKQYGFIPWYTANSYSVWFRICLPIALNILCIMPPLSSSLSQYKNSPPLILDYPLKTQQRLTSRVIHDEEDNDDFFLRATQGQKKSLATTTSNKTSAHRFSSRTAQTAQQGQQAQQVVKEYDPAPPFQFVINRSSVFERLRFPHDLWHSQQLEKMEDVKRCSLRRDWIPWNYHLPQTAGIKQALIRYIRDVSASDELPEGELVIDDKGNPQQETRTRRQYKPAMLEMKSRIFCLQGPSGSGKTSLAVQALEEAGYDVLWIHAGTITYYKKSTTVVNRKPKPRCVAPKRIIKARQEDDGDDECDGENDVHEGYNTTGDSAREEPTGDDFDGEGGLVHTVETGTGVIDDLFMQKVYDMTANDIMQLVDYVLGRCRLRFSRYALVIEDWDVFATHNTIFYKLFRPILESGGIVPSAGDKAYAHIVRVPIITIMQDVSISQAEKKVLRSCCVQNTNYMFLGEARTVFQLLRKQELLEIGTKYKYAHPEYANRIVDKLLNYLDYGQRATFVEETLTTDVKEEINGKKIPLQKALIIFDFMYKGFKALPTSSKNKIGVSYTNLFDIILDPSRIHIFRDFIIKMSTDETPAIIKAVQTVFTGKWTSTWDMYPSDIWILTCARNYCRAFACPELLDLRSKLNAEREAFLKKPRVDKKDPLNQHWWLKLPDQRRREMSNWLSWWDEVSPVFWHINHDEVANEASSTVKLVARTTVKALCALSPTCIDLHKLHIQFHGVFASSALFSTKAGMLEEVLVNSVSSSSDTDQNNTQRIQDKRPALSLWRKSNSTITCDILPFLSIVGGDYIMQYSHSNSDVPTIPLPYSMWGIPLSSAPSVVQISLAPFSILSS